MATSEGPRYDAARACSRPASYFEWRDCLSVIDVHATVREAKRDRFVPPPQNMMGLCARNRTASGTPEAKSEIHKDAEKEEPEGGCQDHIGCSMRSLPNPRSADRPPSSPHRETRLTDAGALPNRHRLLSYLPRVDGRVVIGPAAGGVECPRCRTQRYRGKKMTCLKSAFLMHS